MQFHLQCETIVNEIKNIFGNERIVSKIKYSKYTFEY